MYRELSFDPPFVLLLSVYGVRNVAFYVDRDFHTWNDDWSLIDRDALTLPDVTREALDADVALVLKPTFDAMWQAGGKAGSFSYDDKGAWHRPIR